MYRLADPLGACTVNIFKPGWYREDVSCDIFPLAQVVTSFNIFPHIYPLAQVSCMAFWWKWIYYYSMSSAEWGRRRIWIHPSPAQWPKCQRLQFHSSSNDKCAVWVQMRNCRRRASHRVSTCKSGWLSAGYAANFWRCQALHCKCTARKRKLIFWFFVTYP